ncbi:MAG: LPS export ABC transporter periplasmic protein LptC [Bacteroidota bacterium]
MIACGPEESQPEVGDFLETEVYEGVESFGVEYYFSDSARVSAQMFATRVIEREEPVVEDQEVEKVVSPVKDEDKEVKTEMVHFLSRGVRLYFLNFRGIAHSTIKSDSGVFRREKGIAQLIGQVEMTNHENETMKTEELFWDKEKDSVYTDKFVRIETPDKIITGSRGLRANTDFTSYTIFGIRGEIETEE